MFIHREADADMGGKKEEIEMGGGKHKVHTGPRGGKYIVRGGVKVYI
jgi:hypothetical protein